MTKKFFAVLCITCLVLSLSMSVMAQTQKKPKVDAMTGIITDEKCASGPGAANADCAKRCIEGGAKAVFVFDSDKSVMTIDNPEKIKGHEGHHVAVIGAVANNTLHVESVKMLEEKGETK